MTALHSTSTFNIRASFNQWFKDALDSIVLPLGVTYTFVNTWPDSTTLPTPSISVIHADIGRSPEYLGRLVDSAQMGVSAAGLADISVWVSRSAPNWQQQLSILTSAVEAVFAGTTAFGVRDYTANTSSPKNQYTQQVLDLGSTNLIQYLRMNDTSGTTAQDSSSENNDGTYTGVTLDADEFLTGEAVPRWDGTGDVLNLYSAALATDFNPSEFTISIWLKVASSGIWTDGTDRRLVSIFVDGSNFIFIRRATSNNNINMTYAAGGTVKQVNPSGLSSTDWLNFILTVSASNDRMRGYVNGVQVGTDQTALGVWAGALPSTFTVVGASNTSAASAVMNGWMSNLAILKTELTPAQVATLATIPGGYQVRIVNLDMGVTMADTGNVNIMRTRNQLRYEWVLRASTS